MEQRELRCDVCGCQKKLTLVGPHWERDESGRPFQRFQCPDCRAHAKFYSESKDVPKKSSKPDRE